MARGISMNITTTLAIVNMIILDAMIFMVMFGNMNLLDVMNAVLNINYKSGKIQVFFVQLSMDCKYSIGNIEKEAIPMVKKIFAIAMFFLCILFIGVIVEPSFSAADAAANPLNTTVDYIDTLPAREENIGKTLTRSSFYTVSVNIPCDEEWREQTSWSTLARNAVESADDYLYDEFGIDFSDYTFDEWDSYDSFRDIGLLNEAISECGLNGQDHMVAFTGQTNSQYAGWGKLGDPYALVIDKGATNNKKIARHEIGHTYGLSHCTENCLMHESSVFYSYWNTLCTDHYDLLDENKGSYGS